MDYFNKMDSAGGYVRASLLGLSQGMSPLHDPLRLHPALHSQIVEANKDSTGTLLRPLTDYPHIPLLPFSAPPFLPPHLDPRLPFSHSPFHSLHAKLSTASTSSSPLITSSPNTPNHTSISSVTGSSALTGSAFAPLPPKVSKLDPDCGVPAPISSSSFFNHSVLLSTLDARNAFLGGRSPPLISGGSLNEDRRDSPSPMGSHGSRESPAHSREAATPNSPGEEFRVRKNRSNGDCWCPVCGITLRAGEFEPHLTLELETLSKHLHGRPTTPSGAPGITITSSPHRPQFTNPLLRVRDPGWETYQRVRANRQVRLRTKKRRSGRGDGCPVCGDRVGSGTIEEMQAHVEQCIRRVSLFGLMQAAVHDEDGDVDVEGDSPFEEFDWGGQRRGRLFPSLLRANDLSLSGTRDCEMKTLGSDKERPCSREMEKGSSGGHEGDEKRMREDTEGGRGRVEKGAEALEKELEALKEKIRSIEKEGSDAPKFSCYVCRKLYERPTVSLVCWHVFCESCWPNSRETKAECPQCSTVFNADDIRLIHL